MTYESLSDQGGLQNSTSALILEKLVHVHIVPCAARSQARQGGMNLSCKGSPRPGRPRLTRTRVDGGRVDYRLLTQRRNRESGQGGGLTSSPAHSGSPGHKGSQSQEPQHLSKEADLSRGWLVLFSAFAEDFFGGNERVTDE